MGVLLSARLSRYKGTVTAGYVAVCILLFSGHSADDLLNHAPPILVICDGSCQDLLIKKRYDLPEHAEDDAAVWRSIKKEIDDALTYGRRRIKKKVRIDISSYCVRAN